MGGLLTQEAIEILSQTAEGRARLSQLGYEVLFKAPGGNALLTQEGIEVLWKTAATNALLTQEAIEVLTPVGGIVPVRPANDLFANAQVLVGASACVDTFNWNEGQALPFGGATSEGANDPLDQRFHNYGRGTVWYQWTAPGDGFLEVTTDAPNTGTPIGDTVLGVYTGSTLATLVEVAFNDDYLGDPYAKLFDVPVVSGTIYTIEVTGFDDTGLGAFQLCWAFTAALVEGPIGVVSLFATMEGPVLPH